MDEKKRIAFIVNPISGVLDKHQIMEGMARRLDREAYEARVVYTERAGHAVEIAAREAAEEA